MKTKLFREVVVLPQEEHRLLLKLQKQLQVPKSKVFRLGLQELVKQKQVLDNVIT